jgi:NAD+ kinase
MVLKRRDPRVREVVTDMIPWLQSRGVEVFLDEAASRQYGLSVETVEPEELASMVDLVAVFGGDGTFLYAARLVATSDTPLLGINLGSLGFLTEVKLSEMQGAFEELLSGRYTLERRMLLAVRVTRGEHVLADYMALNDAVINKGALARIIELEISVNMELVSLTRADGLIVSTPTGSTAYSMAAGGPILYPTLAACIITPICPHTLTNRPVVVTDDARIDICLRRGSDVMLTVDGQVGMPLVENDCVQLQKAGSAVHLVQVTGSTFFKLLREKLKWG